MQVERELGANHFLKFGGQLMKQFPDAHFLEPIFRDLQTGTDGVTSDEKTEVDPAVRVVVAAEAVLAVCCS